MDSRSAYRLQVMEKLGAPLLRALPAGMDGEKAAETVAALIAKSVQAGLQLSQSMRLTDDDGDIDSIRLSLAAIAAPLLADAYKETGRLPDDASIAQLAKGLEASLVFAENFTPAIEHSARLKSLHDPLPVIDTTQIPLLTLNALLPAVRAAQHFSFGQSEVGFIKDVASRLKETAQQIATASVKGDDGDRAFAGLMVLRALAELYAASHAQALQGHQGGDAPTAQAAWDIFDQQAAMMLALSGAAVPDKAAASGSSSGPANPMGAFKKPDAAPPAAPPASGNPMSFFKPGAKKTGDDA